MHSATRRFFFLDKYLKPSVWIRVRLSAVPRHRSVLLRGQVVPSPLQTGDRTGISALVELPLNSLVWYFCLTGNNPIYLSSSVVLQNLCRGFPANLKDMTPLLLMPGDITPTNAKPGGLLDWHL